MKELIKLAERIKDKKLKKKVIDFLKDFRLSSKDFKKYTPEKIKEAGSLFVIPSSGFGPVERKILEHTITLVELCEDVVKCFKKNYGLELNRDYLVAAAILHDLMKAFEYKRGETGELEPTGVMLDHTMLAVAELYVRDFPEEVIHIVASHYGEAGPTPPRTFEALVFHYLDSLTSIIEYYHQVKKKFDKKILFLTEEELKKIGENAEKF